MQPSLFYIWQRQRFENVETALAGGKKGASGQDKALAARVATTLCSRLDGASRAIAHWEIREQDDRVRRRVRDAARTRALPSRKTRIISDNGPQFIAKDFKEFIRAAGMTHVRTTPYYPQSNGKLERWHGTVKSEAIHVTPAASRRPSASHRRPLRRALQRRAASQRNRLHQPNDFLAGRRDEIHSARDAKLEAAREARRQRRARCGGLNGATNVVVLRLGRGRTRSPALARVFGAAVCMAGA